MRLMERRQVWIGLGVLFLAMVLAVGPAWAADPNNKPARGLSAALVYPGMTIGPEDDVKIDLKLKNTGRSDETVLFEVTEKPEGWKAEIKDFNKSVSGMFLAEDDYRTLNLTARPEGDPKRLPAGTYRFVVQVKTSDGSITRTTSTEVTVLEGKKAAGDIKLTTSYPILRGPSDSKFEFTLDINNETEEDSLFNLSANASEGWEISFKPAYEDKQISSLKIKAGSSSSVGVQVTPPARSEAGDYPFKVRVQSGKAKADVDLTVVLTGTYKIKTGTLNGLLSLATQKGQDANISLYVRNEGSAVQREISFVSFKPENWKVKFNPEKLDNLKPDELKQIEVTIIPSEEALVGDYSVAISAQGEKSTSEVELRVTVKASSAWGWIGIGIIMLVIIGLAVAFRRLGRR